MTPSQRNKAMEEWDAARVMLFAAELELEQARFAGEDELEIDVFQHAAGRYRDEVNRIERQFPEVRLWKSRAKR